MKRDNAQLIDLADAHHVQGAADALGVTPHQIRAAAAIVGRSAGALSRYFRAPPAAPDGPTFLERHALAQELADLYSRINSDPAQAGSLQASVAPLLTQVVRAVRQGEIRLDYLPPEGDTVSIPSPGDPLYLQALLYWRIRLDAPLADILEAVASAGLDPTVDEVLGRLVHIGASARRGGA